MYRELLSKQYMKGVGCEIGSGRAPWINVNKCHISYCEKDHNLCPDFVDISQISSDNFNFVCHSHVLEHLEDPIGFLKENIRIIKKGGYVLMVVPDKSLTFDVTRELTTFDHLWTDYTSPEVTKKQKKDHLYDFAMNTKPPQRPAWREFMKSPDWNTHYHVWNNPSLFDHLTRLAPTLQFTIMSFNQEGFEIFVVLRKD